MLLSVRTRLSIAGVVATIAVAVAGCGSSSNNSGQASTAAAAGGSDAEATFVRAADVSESAKGYKFRMSLDETIPGSGSVQLNGTGAFSAPSNSLAMTLDAAEGGKHVSLQEIAIGPVFYIKEPAAVAAKLPGDKPWLELDLDQVGKGSYLSALSSLIGSSQESNPAEALDYLKAESTHIQNLGQATVGGVPVTHYRATVDLNKAGSGLSPSAHAATQTLLRKLPATILNKTALPIDVWIDASHFVRQETVMMKLVPSGSSETLDASLKLSLTDYGAQPAPTPPPASETANMLALLKAEGKTSLLSGGSSSTG
jgi:hypothetical protein